MKEFQPTTKSIERTRRAGERAKGTLQSFLDSSFKAIRAVIAYNKIVDMEGAIPFQELQKLGDFIRKESEGKLSWTDGMLCEIGESGEEFAEGHEGVLFGRELGVDAKAVKGCYFSVDLKNQNFECVVLDGGGSRKYFDDKDKSAKRQYVERFANRRRGSLVFTGRLKDLEKLPLGFTAFLTDTGEKLVIEEVVGYRSVENLTRRK